jgi:hypothetical protein
MAAAPETFANLAIHSVRPLQSTEQANKLLIFRVFSGVARGVNPDFSPSARLPRVDYLENLSAECLVLPCIGA